MKVITPQILRLKHGILGCTHLGVGHLSTTQNDSFAAIRAEADKYRTTKTATDSDIVEVWSYAAGRVVAKDMGLCVKGVSVIFIWPLLFDAATTLVVNGGPIMMAAFPQIILLGLLATAAGTAVGMVGLGLYRYGKDVDAMIATKDTEAVVQSKTLPDNPRVLKQAIELTKIQGEGGERLSALRHKFYVIDPAKMIKQIRQRLDI
jgi:hypothetical protein